MEKSHWFTLAQILVGAFLAIGGLVWGASWLIAVHDARLDSFGQQLVLEKTSLNNRVDSVDRRLSERIKAMDVEHATIRAEHGNIHSELAKIKERMGVQQGKCNARGEGVQQRLAVLENLVPRILDVAQLIRDSNDLPRMRMRRDGDRDNGE